MDIEKHENKLTFYDALERLRSKLIDLSNRNKLLNFRHTKRSSLRFVDELPDFIAKNLLQGKNFTIDAIPLPTEEDEMILDKEREDITVKEIAELRGIDLNFENPKPKDLEEEKHSDNNLQTNLFPQELEKNLSKISGDSRLAIEEKGVNMLYLSLGFLEWYESSTSDIPRIAPLYLIPIRLEKNGYDNTNECHKYSICYSGEDIYPNASLQKKLEKEFDIELPDIEDEAGPEKYFLEINNIIGEKSRWKIRRYATISLLHFSKILMYNDLSPDNNIITKSGLINQIFSEADAEDSEMFSENTELEEYDIDKISIPDMPLVYDADSSQCHVLIDAQKGKNLVVEGPPGTGKSQTITNLIAASLAEGKTVLFVSEKLAALEVVRNKLDRVGLGNFCLELHSHKTQKKKLLGDLSKRINDSRYLDSSSLDNDIQILTEVKERLNNYAELINRKHGNTGESISNILCSAVHYKNLITKHWGTVRNIIIDSPEKIDVLFLEKAKDVITTYIASLEQLENNTCLNKHIWYGVRVSNINSYEFDNAKIILEDCCNKLKAFMEAISSLEKKYSCELSRNKNSLTSYFTVISQFENFKTKDIAWDKVIALSEANLYRTTKEFISEYKDIIYRLSLLKETSYDNLDLSLKKNDKIIKLENNLNKIDIPNCTLENIYQIWDFLKDNKEKIDFLKELTHNVGDAIGKKIPMSFLGIKFSANLAKVLKDVPEHAFKYRKVLMDEEIESFVKEANVQYQKLIIEKNEIEEKLDLSQIISLDDLKTYTSEMQTAGFFSLWSSNYRKAKKYYKLIFKDSKLSQSEKIKYCSKTINYKKELYEFENSEKYKSKLKDAFSGIETNFEEYEKFYEWTNDLSSFIRKSLSEKDKEIVDKLFSFSIKKLKRIGDYAKHSLDQLLEGITNIDFINKTNDFDIEDILINKIKYFNSFVDNSSEFNFNNMLKLKDIIAFIDEYKKLYARNKTLGDNKHILNILNCKQISIDTNITIINDTITAVDYLNNQTEEIRAFFKKAKSYKDFCIAVENIEELKRFYNQFDAVYELLISTLEIKQEEWLRYLDSSSLDNVYNFLKECKKNEASLLSWGNYVRAANKCKEYGLHRLIDLVEDAQFQCEHLHSAYLASFYYRLSLDIMAIYPELKDFRGAEHEILRNKYAAMDKKVIDNTGAIMAKKISGRGVPVGNSRGRVKELTELSFIKHEIRKKTRHAPIRELVRRAGKALVGLKPCFMMGPYSIPQYLSFNNIKFDLIIMDEASQMFPEYAIGALARAKQAIIVGDSKQLPPTSFFNQAQTLIEDEGEMFAIEDGESILDAASGAFQQKRRLKWHYRSRHDSLIAFSNKYFYDNDLIVFPSIHTENENLGVKFRYIEDGRCDKGKNPLEARAVAKAIIEHFATTPDLSLGVATTNMVQMELVKDELERELRENPQYRKYIDDYEDINEPFFVKNLENVQGDERDVIFISIAYGKSSDGSFIQNFGPINQASGWRRLNVLFTRAKNKVVLFSSMSSKDIKTSFNSPRGVIALKDYLDFAETGNLRQPKLTGKAPDSPFEIQVMEKLNQHGFVCEAQIGVAGYFIDIGVYHPEHKGQFILGIECDGATYHSSKSARDRDRLREQVLRDQGWNIHRIWSTDWFNAPENEIGKIIKKANDIII